MMRFILNYKIKLKASIAENTVRFVGLKCLRCGVSNDQILHHAYAVILSQRLAGKSIRVAPVYLGWVQTKMGGESALITVEQSANGIYKALIENTKLISSRMFRKVECKIISLKVLFTFPLLYFTRLE
jgi:hypothetical protein